MPDRLEALKLFARVARTGSFSRAGRELGLPQPSVSRVIAELERELGVALLTRSTRAVVLTDAGTEYLARIEPLLLALEEANQSLRGTPELRGVVRVGLPASIAIREIIPRLPRFMDRHPALRVELQLKDEKQDLLRDGVDVAFRVGELSDSTATSRVVAVIQRVVVASPAYLQRAGTPAAPADLAKHSILMGPPAAIPGAWSFERAGKTVSVELEARLKSNVNEGAIAAAIAGLGIVLAGDWGCRTELASGALVRVLPDWKLAPHRVHALFPAGRATKLAARRLVDYLVEALKE
jgi:DNA-binding transcriptional LysR family regulator